MADKAKKTFTSAEIGIEPDGPVKFSSADLGIEPSIVEVPPETESALMKVVNLVAKPAGKALKTVSEPFAALDKISGAPVRAGLAAAQNDGNIIDILGAAGDQFAAGLPTAQRQGELLPTTPEMADLAYEGMTKSGIKPEFAASMAPPMGAVADIALDPTMLLPSRTATKAVETVGDLARLGVKKAGRAYGAAEAVATGAIAGTANFMTRGALQPEKALNMYKKLSSWEMLFPGDKQFGAMSRQGQKIGEMRQAFRAQPIAVPGSHETALGMISQIQEAQRRMAMPPAKAQAAIEFIKERAFEKRTNFDPLNPDVGAIEELVAKDMTLDELDDVVQNVDDIIYTPQGKDRSLDGFFGPAIKKTRAMADEVMQTVPEGQLFKSEKGQYEALATAGKERSHLVESMSDAGGVASLVTKEWWPVVAAKAIIPGTFVNALAVVKMPRETAQMLAKAQASGSVTMLRDALQSAAAKHPFITERLVRGTMLLAGKPQGNQTLDESEVELLAVPKSFDPEVIAQERTRIQNDSNIPSTQKAKALSDINKNGYVNLPQPEMAAADPTEQVFGGQVGLEDLVKSLEAVQ